MIRGLLFDFDLTLAESSKGTTECANFALTKLGLPIAPADAIRRTIGLSLEQTFRMLTLRSDPQLERDFARWFVSRADEVMAPLTTLFPGTAEALGRLRSDGLTTAVVSTKYRYRIESILVREGLLWAFDAIIGREDVSLPKPHPEGIRRALTAIGVEPGHALFIGDHPVDAKASSAAGLRFVATLTGTSTMEDFTGLPVAGFVETLADVRALVGRL
jgi:phosphoglycolate phosphatase